MRDVAVAYCFDHALNVPIGGVDPNGVPRIVECDESMFFKRHGNVGRLADRQGWVFGCVERGTNRVLMQIVDRRDAQTLIPIIIDWIAPGTRIITDGWATYHQIGNLQHLVNGALQQRFGHDAVNHQLHFVDPNDPDVHTQTIEATWGAIKRQLRTLHGTSVNYFESYLMQYMFRRTFQHRHIFVNYVFWIRHYFPV